jgi:hypothetical protein
MEVGLFPWVAGLCMVCFLPGWFWDSLVPRLRSALPGLEGVAQRLQRLPHVAARSVRAHLAPLWARSSSAMGLTAYGDRPANGSTTTAGEGGQHGEAGSQPVTLRSSLATNLLALFFLFYILCWNLTTVSPISMPTPAYALGPFSGVYQNWIMFSPDPPKDDGWWVIPGNLQGGRQVDLMSVVRGDYGLHEVSYEKPDSILATYDNEHWHKYLEFITTLEYYKTPEERADRRVDQREQRENLSRYLCRAWNEHHAGDESLENLQIVYMREPTLPDYQRPKVERVVLHEHSCQ